MLLPISLCIAHNQQACRYWTRVYAFKGETHGPDLERMILIWMSYLPLMSDNRVGRTLICVPSSPRGTLTITEQILQ